MDYRKTQVKVDFSPFSQMVALPPMATISRPDTLADEIYPLSIRLDEALVFREAGYYRVSDPQSGAGLGFLIGKNEFPLLSTPQELMDPMIYISTREERNLLLQSENSKLALDQFWLKISPQKDRARELIKKYFLQIEQANRSFSILKEGWKTDMGMVMAIFGPPVQVFRSRDTEIWIYDKNQSPESTLFYFFRQDAGNFGDIWELKRLSDYDKIWYGVVDLWRKGLIDR
jgi:GWxTD domain-containing protein